ASYVQPRIDAAEDDQRSVEAMTERLNRGPLRNHGIASIHGRMRPADKELEMARFREGTVKLLVSTTVIEVGIDVAEATAMVVIGAERYGLAQLHQLRGRVGRGKAASRCYLCHSPDIDATAHDRLDVMMRCHAGSQIAEADLKLRGPGDLLGARQTGALPLRFGHLLRDYHLVDQARELAEQWLARDAELRKPSSPPARREIRKMP